MKKLKLNELNLGNAEVLTREQLKKVLGGDGGSGGSGNDTCLVCVTPGGEGCWFVRDTSQGTTAACCNIYPAYCSQLWGFWSDCTPGCAMN